MGAVLSEVKNMNRIALFALAYFAGIALSKSDGEFEFVSKIESIQRDGRDYTFITSIENMSRDFSVFHVENPNEWGKTKFATRINHVIRRSTSPLMISPLGVSGMIFRHGDKFKFVYRGSANDGLIDFKETGERLEIFERNPEIRIEFALYVSDFKSGKCSIVRLETNWAKIEFPFSLSNSANGDVDKSPVKLPDLPKD